MSEKNAEYFFSLGLDGNCHIKRRKGDGYGLCGEVVLFAVHVRGPGEAICGECFRMVEMNAKLAEKNRPFQNCFEDCPLGRKPPDWDKITRLGRQMNALLDELEEEVW